MAFVAKSSSSLSINLSKLLASRIIPLSSNLSIPQRHSFIKYNHCASLLNSTRNLHTSSPSFFSDVKKENDTVRVTVRTEDDCVTLEGKIGDSVLDLVTKNNYEIVGYGACEGTIACSTCHIILKEEDFKHHNRGFSEEEQDLLDMVSHVTTKTSRLGCQVYLNKHSDGMEIFIPPPTDIRDD